MAIIGFVGTGMMAEAIIGGMLRGGFHREEIMGADPDAGRRAYMQTNYGLHFAQDNQALAKLCDVLVMSLKPQYFSAALPQLQPALRADHRIISIMAGVTTEKLESSLRCADGEGSSVLSVVRAMPNTPALTGMGMTCLCRGKAAESDDVELARRIFLTVGAVADVEERLLDAATGVAGCGPAYVYMFIEALADGGVMMGLPRQLSLRLAAETLKGAAQMVLDGNKHVGELKDNVCSPGGATIEGVYTLEKSGMRGALMEAVKAGVDKCEVIAKNA